MLQQIEAQADVLVEAKDMKYNVMYRGTVDPSIIFIRIHADRLDYNGVVLLIRPGSYVQATPHSNVTGKLMLEPNGTKVKWEQFLEPVVDEIDMETIIRPL